jgi:hypothetical protein
MDKVQKPSNPKRRVIKLGALKRAASANSDIGQGNEDGGREAVYVGKG